MITQEGSGYPHEPESSIHELQTASPDQFRDLTTQAVDLLAVAIEAQQQAPDAPYVLRNGVQITLSKDEHGFDTAKFVRGRTEEALASGLLIRRDPEYGYVVQQSELLPHPQIAGDGVFTAQSHAMMPNVASLRLTIRGKLNETQDDLLFQFPIEKTMPPLLASQAQPLSNTIESWRQAVEPKPSRQSWLGRICRGAVRRQD